MGLGEGIYEMRHVACMLCHSNAYHSAPWPETLKYSAEGRSRLRPSKCEYVGHGAVRYAGEVPQAGDGATWKRQAAIDLSSLPSNRVHCVHAFLVKQDERRWRNKLLDSDKAR